MMGGFSSARDGGIAVRGPLARLYRMLLRRKAPWIIVLILMLATPVVHTCLDPLRINHDCADLLQIADGMLDGRLPYVDAVETNPPLIIYLYLPAAALARAIGLHPILAFTLMMDAWLILTTCQLAWLTGRLKARLPFPEQAVLLVCWLLGHWLAYVFNEFGQRDVLFMELYLPFAVLRLARMEGSKLPSWLGWALGIQAALGVCLKPHFFVVAASVEIVQLRVFRRFRALLSPEVFGFAGAVVLYAAHWLFVPREMREVYLGRWVPWVWRYYDESYCETSYGGIILMLLRNGPAMALILLTDLALWLGIRTRGPARGLILTSAAVSAMTLVEVILQRKAWSYHFLAYCIAAFWMAGVMVTQVGLVTRNLRFLRGLRYDALVGPFLLGTASLAGFWCGYRAGWRFLSDPYASVADLRHLVAGQTNPGDRVLILSTGIEPAHPLLLQMGRKPAGRYIWTIPIAFFSRAASSSRPGSEDAETIRRRKDEELFLRELRADIDSYKPRLVVAVDSDRNPGCPRGFTIPNYLERSGLSRYLAERYRAIAAPSGYIAFRRVETDRPEAQAD
jgi:hypothetical protein